MRKMLVAVVGMVCAAGLAVAAGIDWMPPIQGSFTGGSVAWTNNQAPATIRGVLVTVAAGTTNTVAVKWVSAGVTNTLASTASVTTTYAGTSWVMYCGRGDVIQITATATNSHDYTILRSP